MKRRRTGAVIPGRSRYNWAGWANAAGNAVNAAVAFRNRYNNSVTRSSTSSRDTAPLTNQFDTRVLYVKKRGNKKRQRRARKFSRKVLSVVDRKLVAPWFIMRTSTASLNPSAGGQEVVGMSLNGFAGNGGSDNDLSAILTCVEAQHTGSSTQNEAFDLMSSFLDVTIRNTDSANTAYIDLYYLKLRKDVTTNSTTFRDMFADSLGFTVKPTGGVASLTPTTYGANPFNCSDFCRYCLITKKRQIILSPGQVSCFELKDSKRRTIKYSDNLNKFGGPKLGTCGILMIVYGAPDNAGVVSQSITNLVVTYQRTYDVRPLAEGFNQ